MTDAPVLLSCEQCKKRKTKCDKTFPRCSACKAANINCHPVQRSRLPRGRTGNAKHKSITLADKVARLENLVGRLESQIQDHENALVSVESGTLESAPNAIQSTNRIEDLLAKDFWVALSKEVTGLRETLEGTDGEDSQSPETVVQPSPSGTQAVPTPFLFNRGPETLKHSDTYSNQSMRAILIQIYYDRVDILFKVTHWPTVLKYLQANDHNDIAPKSNVASVALEWCICFTAATTLSEQDCEELRLGPKILLVEHCRLSAENFLSQSNFLVEPTFLTVQSFTIYLMGLRTSGQGALTWTLTALAVRLANALDLGSETNNSLSSLDIEQRRRVWFAIGLLDSQTAMGRGSVPVIPHRDLNNPPLDINDAEVGVRTVSVHLPTEMFFSCVTHQALLCQRRLCDPLTPSFCDRAEIVASFEAIMNHKYAHLETSDVPIERYTALVASDICTNMHLLLRRPPYKCGQSDTNYGTFNILNTATEVLERGLTKQHSLEFQRWSWFTWPRWYALAIVLVELCSVTINPPMESDTTRHNGRDREIAKAYTIAMHSFTNYAQSASDVASGTIWTPIVKLMKRVQQIHGTIDTSSPHNYSVSAPVSAHLTSEMEIVPTHLSQNTILSRYCEAMSDSKSNSTQLDIDMEMNPDLLWDAFLEDLSDINVDNFASSGLPLAPVSTLRPAFGIPNTSSSMSTPSSASGPAQPSGSTSASASTWSLMPYAPILPHLTSRFNVNANMQGQQQQWQQGSGQAKRTGKGGNSVLGPIVL